MPTANFTFEDLARQALGLMLPASEIDAVTERYLSVLPADVFSFDQLSVDQDMSNRACVYFKPSASVLDLLKFQLLGIDNIYIALGNDFFGNPANWCITLDYTDEQEKYLEVTGLSFRIGFKNMLLKPSDGSSEYAEVHFKGGFRLYESLDFLLMPEQGLSMRECNIGTTGMTVSFQNILPDLSERFTPEKIVSVGYDETFKGLFAEEGKLRLLPECIFNNERGIEIAIQNAFLSESGVSFFGYAAFDIRLKDDFSAIEQADLRGRLLNFDFALGLASIQFLNNMPAGFNMKGFCSLPCFKNTVFETSLGLLFDSDGVSQLHMRIAAFKGLRIANFLASSSANLIEIGEFTAIGIAKEGFLSLSGKADDIQLNLPGIFGNNGVQIDIGVIDTTLEINQDYYKYGLEISNLPFGVLGTLDSGELNLEIWDNEATESRIYMHSKLEWKDLKDKLPSIPSSLHSLVPADDAALDVYLEWETLADEEGDLKTGIHIKLAAEISDPLLMWDILPIPDVLQMDVRSLKLAFDIRYQEGEEAATMSNGQFNGSFAVQVEIQLPVIPDFLEGIEITTGDEEGWVTLKMAIDNMGSATPAFAVSVENPVTTQVTLPGLNQEFPNITAGVDSFGLKLARVNMPEVTYDEIDLELAGNYLLKLDVERIPLPEPFKGAFNFLKQTVDDLNPVPSLWGKLSGNINVKQYSGGSNELEWSAGMKCLFEGLDAELNINDMLQFFTTGVGASVDLGAKEILLSALEVGCQIRNTEIRVTNKKIQGNNNPLHFTFRLNAELRFITTLIPVYIEISDQTIAVGLDEMALPLQLSLPPIDEELFNYASGDVETWYNGKYDHFDGEIETESKLERKRQLAMQRAILELTHVICRQIPERKDNYLRWLKMLATQYAMLHRWIPGGDDGSFQLKGLPYIKFDRLLAGDYENMMALDKDAVLMLKGIRLEVDPRDIRKSSMSGSIKFSNFKEDNFLRILEIIEWQFGLTADLIYFSLKTPGKVYFPQLGNLEGVPIPQIISLPGEELTPAEQIAKGKKGYIRIDKAMLGFGYTRRSFAVQFEGECRLPEQLLDLLQEFQQGSTEDIFYALPPRKTSLYFRFELIPIPIAEIVIVIPYLEFSLDLRSEVSPGLISTRECKPFWDGIQFHVKNVIEADFKKVGFSPMFLGEIAPTINYSYDLKIGNEDFGMTYIADNISYCYGKFMPYMLLPYVPVWAPPTPWLDNMCYDLRFVGFGINFNFQRPIPSFALDALLEVLAIISDPKYKIQPNGTLANSFRIAITDIYLKIPDYAKPFLPKIAEELTKPVDLVLNVSTFQHLFVNAFELTEKLSKLLPWKGDANTVYDANWLRGQVTSLAMELSPERIAAMVQEVMSSIPIEMRVFSTTANLGGFEGNATLAMVSLGEVEDRLLHPVTNRRTNIEVGSSDTPESMKDKLKQMGAGRFSSIELTPPLSGFELQVCDPDKQNAVLFSNQLKNLSPALLGQIRTEVGADAKGMMLAADVSVFGQQAFNFIGFMGEVGQNTKGFVLYSSVSNPKLSLSVAKINVPVTLNIDGSLKLYYALPDAILQKTAKTLENNLNQEQLNEAVDELLNAALSGSGFIEASSKAKWEAIPGKVVVYLGQEAQAAVFTPMILFGIDLPMIIDDEATEIVYNRNKDRFFSKRDKNISVSTRELVNHFEASLKKEGTEANQAANLLVNSFLAKEGKAYAKDKSTKVSWDDKSREMVVRNNKSIVRVSANDLATAMSGVDLSDGDDDLKRLHTRDRKRKKRKEPEEGGSKGKKGKFAPCQLTLDSRGRFILSGSGEMVFFPEVKDLIARLSCDSFLVMNEHVQASGGFVFDYNFPKVNGISVGRLAFEGSCSGSIRSHDHFSFRGHATSDMEMLGLKLSGGFSVTESMMEMNCALKGSGGNVLSIYGFHIELDSMHGSAAIRFKDGVGVELEGDISVRKISYRGTDLNFSTKGKGSVLLHSDGKAEFKLDGNIIWNGQEWIGGKIRIAHDQFEVEGNLSINASLQQGGGDYALTVEADLFGGLQMQMADSLKLKASSAFKVAARVSATMAKQVLPIASATFSKNIELPASGQPKMSLIHLPVGTGVINFAPQNLSTIPGPGSVAVSVTGKLPLIPSINFETDTGTISGTSSPLPTVNFSDFVPHIFPSFTKSTNIYLEWTGGGFELKREDV